MSTDDKVMEALHDHDKRLVAVETEMRGIHTEIRALKADIAQNATVSATALEKISEVAIKVSGLASSHKLVLLLLGVGVPLLVGLEAYAVFFGE